MVIKPSGGVRSNGYIILRLWRFLFLCMELFIYSLKVFIQLYYMQGNGLDDTVNIKEGL